MKTLTVHDPEKKPIYDILFSKDYSALPDALQSKSLVYAGRRICIVSETNVAPLYAEEVVALFRQCGAEVTVFIFPAGEASKNLDVVRQLYEHLILQHFDRKDMLVALGGGVVGDLTGFCAATYLRGIDFIQLPTSLLSQVDSSIGGKTGVDFDAYKNMVGAFYQPKLVYINLSVLKTLGEKEYLSGMGEIIKHGLIKDKNYYQEIKDSVSGILARDTDVLENIVYQSCNIKRHVVENDPKEKGERALLNFGHTIGHAIEKLANFRLLHGDCVSIGACAAAFLSMKRGMISPEEYDSIVHTFESYHLPVSLSETDSHINSRQVVSATKLDKKMESGHIKFILLQEIGSAVIDKTVSDDELLCAVSSVLK